MKQPNSDRVFGIMIQPEDKPRLSEAERPGEIGRTWRNKKNKLDYRLVQAAELL